MDEIMDATTTGSGDFPFLLLILLTWTEEEKAPITSASSGHEVNFHRYRQSIFMFYLLVKLAVTQNPSLPLQFAF